MSRKPSQAPGATSRTVAKPPRARATASGLPASNAAPSVCGPGKPPPSAAVPPTATDLFDRQASTPMREVGQRIVTATPTLPSKPLEPKPTPRPKSRAATAAGVPRRNSTKLSSARNAAAPKPPRRLSALDAAARILSDLPPKAAAAGITAAALVERMAAARLWTSPGGKTPAATLYAAMIREIAAKKGASRFRRIGKGLFGPGVSTPRSTVVKDTPAAKQTQPKVRPPARSSGTRASE